MGAYMPLVDRTGEPLEQRKIRAMLSFLSNEPPLSKVESYVDRDHSSALPTRESEQMRSCLRVTSNAIFRLRPPGKPPGGCLIVRAAANR